MPMEFYTQMNFGSGRVKVTVPSDFYHNCLTRDPYSHSHPKYELHYILSGSCTLRTQEQSLACSQGCFLLIPPRLIHRIIPDNNQVKTLSLLYSTAGGTAFVPEGMGCVLIEDDFGGAERLECIRTELSRREAAFAEKVQGELMALLADLARRCGSQNCPSEPEQEESRAEIIESYLAHNKFNPHCSCSELAKQMHLSTRQVHRLCLQYFNAPFRELLTDMRMEIAAHRLRTTDVPVGELAAQIGYASIESFSAAYKRHFGKAPSRERQGRPDTE